MFHIEMRMGTQVARAFNLDLQALGARFLGPLLADRDFAYEGHEWSPRKTRITIYDAPELPPHKLGLMGRGWTNVEKTGTDVTEALLAQARQQLASQGTGAATSGTPSGPSDALRERLIGRLTAGPVSLDEIVEMAAELMPGSTEEEQLKASEQVAWSLLYRRNAQLTR